MTLQSLTVENFHCHKKKKVQLSPTVTVIIGDNDIGKSSLLNAIEWIATNKPDGKAFVRRGTDVCRASLRFSDAHDADGQKRSKRRRVALRSVKGKRVYELDKKSLAALKRNVPGDVRQALRLEDINFQSQHDPVFWLSLSPPQLARELNKLVDLETIDRVQTTISKRIRSKTAELKVCQSRLKEARRIERLLRPVKNLNNSLKKLDILDAARQTSYVTQCRTILNHASAINRLLDNSGGLRSCVDTLRESGRRCVDCQASIGTLESVLIEATRARATSGDMRPPNMKVLERLRRRQTALDPDITLLDQWLKQAHKLEEEQCHANELANKQRSRVEKTLNGRCPMCGGILTGQGPM